METEREDGGCRSNVNRTPSSSTYSLFSGDTVHITTVSYTFIQ